MQAWPALSGDQEIRHLLRGPDDFMRLAQVEDWLQGQDWRDTRQRRLNPPDGGPMHWSRIADVPLGVSAVLATPVLGRGQAMRIAVIVVPALLGGALVALFFWASAPLVQGKWRVMATLLTLPALILPLAQLRPGRVDHHGLQLVLVALAAGFAFRALNASGGRFAVAAGVVTAVSLVVGLETLPFVAATAFAFLLASIVRADAAVSLVAFGGALATVAPALLWLTAPLPDWATAACDRMSFPHLAGAAACAAIGGIAIALQHVRMTRVPNLRAAGHDGLPETRGVPHAPTLVRETLPDSGWGIRLVAIGGSGIALAGILVALFPQCAGGPYAELAPGARYWLDRVSEAQSLPQYFAGKPGTATGFAMLPVVATVATAIRLRRGGWTDPLRLAALLLALSGVAVGWWQIRGLPYAALVAAIALLPVTQTLNAHVAKMPRLAARLALRLSVPLAYVAALILPVLVQVTVWPATEDDRPTCELDDVLPALHDPHGFERNALTIAAPINLGPEILFRTPHFVLAAPYHRNGRSIADIRRIFAGTEAQALATATDRGVDAIIFCSRYTDTMAYPDRQGFLSERLGNADPPDWLTHVAGDGNGAQLYRMEPDRTPLPP